MYPEGTGALVELVKGNLKEQNEVIGKCTFARFNSPERLSKEMNTNTVGQNPKAIASKT